MRTLLLVLLGLVVLYATNPSVVFAQGGKCAQTVVVHKGESLSLLALRYFGDLLAYPTIVALTNSLTPPGITNPDKIGAGQRVCLSTTRTYTPRALDPHPGALVAPDSLYPPLGAGGFRISSYDVGLEWEPPNRIAGTASMIAVTTKELQSFALDLKGMALTRLAVNGGYPLVQRRGDKVIVYFKTPLAQGEVFDVQIQYRGTPGTVTSGAQSRGWQLDKAGNAVVCNDPFGTSGWTPTSERKGDPVSYGLTITVPNTYSVAYGSEPNQVWIHFAESDGRTRFVSRMAVARRMTGRMPNFMIRRADTVVPFACPAA